MDIQDFNNAYPRVLFGKGAGEETTPFVLVFTQHSLSFIDTVEAHSHSGLFIPRPEIPLLSCFLFPTVRQLMFFDEEATIYIKGAWEI